MNHPHSSPAARSATFPRLAGLAWPAAAAALFLTGCGHPEPTATAPALPPAEVGLLTLSLSEVVDLDEAPATLRAKERATLTPKITGTIASLPVVIGQTVKAGEPLVEISAREILARQQQAQAALDKARRDLAREESLLAQNASTPETVNDLRVGLRIAAAAAEEAEIMVGYTRLLAPFDGVITRQLAHEGDLASPGRPILEMENPGRLRAEADVPEALAARLAVGQPVTVLVPATGEKLAGRVEEIAPTADPASRTFLVKIELPPGHRARSGQFGRVQVPATAREALQVPPAALSWWGQMERVFVEEEGRARLRLVKTGRTLAGGVEILSGLRPGERLVVEGAAGLRDGQPLRVAPAQP